jgi:hypothetical protein
VIDEEEKDPSAGDGPDQKSLPPQAEGPADTKNDADS